MQGTKPTHYLSLNGGPPREIEAEIVEESLACISVNGEELATFMCSPNDLEQLALGFLYNEGLISNLDEVHHWHISKSNCVDVWLKNTAVTLPKRRIITAGCGGGVTFDDLSEQHAPLTSNLSAAPEQLAELMRQMHLGAKLYQRSRGIHTAVLATPDEIILQVEDIGRHNCIDRLRGAALLKGIETEGRILMSSGRISSEMINKARRLGTPIVCSRTSPTSLSVSLAEAWNMTVIGYLRQNRMRVYTKPERIALPEAEL